MAKRTQAFKNNKGTLFATPDGATVSDLELLLQNAQFALQVFANRAAIEEIFKQHDHMLIADVAAIATYEPSWENPDGPGAA